MSNSSPGQGSSMDEQEIEGGALAKFLKDRFASTRNRVSGHPQFLADPATEYADAGRRPMPTSVEACRGTEERSGA